jgi:hypothetical protein
MPPHTLVARAAGWRAHENSITGLLTVAGAAWILHLGARPAAAGLIFTPSFFHGRWAFHTGPVKSFSADAPGDPAGVATAPRQDILRVGIIDWDGVGGATGTRDTRWWSISPGWAPITSIPMAPGRWISFLRLSPMRAVPPAQAPGVCATFEGNEIYSFVVSKSRARVSLIQTDNAGGGAKIFMNGDARGR